MSADIKPCPFCGSADVTVVEGESFRWLVATCNACGARSSEIRKQTTGPGTPDDWMTIGIRLALREWNTRHD